MSKGKSLRQVPLFYKTGRLHCKTLRPLQDYAPQAQVSLAAATWLSLLFQGSGSIRTTERLQPGMPSPTPSQAVLRAPMYPGLQFGSRSFSGHWRSIHRPWIGYGGFHSHPRGTEWHCGFQKHGQKGPHPGSPALVHHLGHCLRHDPVGQRHRVST